MPNLYIIAGPNGAGKTTASYTVLPEFLNCYKFVNADEIAKGISPLRPESASFEAGKFMLNQIEKHLKDKIDFALETTLSTKTYVDTIKKAKKRGYKITILFFWLGSIQIAKARVKKRVESGGHNIPSETIERRYKRGLYAFFNVFLPLCDRWILINNNTRPNYIAKFENNVLKFYKKSVFEKIKKESLNYEY